jgi:hypothetical protein
MGAGALQCSIIVLVVLEEYNRLSAQLDDLEWFFSIVGNHTRFHGRYLGFTCRRGDQIACYGIQDTAQPPQNPDSQESLKRFATGNWL